jgi:septal ring factor EnvC (AmiA/AmiB activator)
MLESGVPLANVIAQMKTFRDQIVNQAVAFGFNKKQIQALINAVDLGDAALAKFIEQLAKFEEEAQGAEAAAKAAAEAARKKREEEAAAARKREADAKKDKFDPLNAPVAQPGVRDVHVHLPFGDPEAVALGVANRLAYDQVTSW